MGDVAVAHASAAPLTAPAPAAALGAHAADVANAATTGANANAAAMPTGVAAPAERFSPGGHALRARARAVNYNLKKSDFGGTPAWLKASSAAPDGGLAHGRAEKGVTSLKIPTAAAANAKAAGGGRFTATAKGKAPVFSVHARAAGEEKAAAAAPAPAPHQHQRAPRARPHGLEFSRAALNTAAGNAAGVDAPHPAGRGGAASTSQASSGRGAPLINRPSSKPAVGGGKKRGRPAANANNTTDHEVHWGSAPSPHRSYISHGGAANSPSRAAYASMLGYESPQQQQRARNNNASNGRFVQNNGGGNNNEVTAAAAVAASAAAAGVLRRVQVRGVFGASFFNADWRAREALLSFEGEGYSNGRRGGQMRAEDSNNPSAPMLDFEKSRSLNDSIPLISPPPLLISFTSPHTHNTPGRVRLAPREVPAPQGAPHRRS